MASPATVPYDAFVPSRTEPRRLAQLALPGRDRASARAARRHVRDTARGWGLPPAAVDDLETIAGELVANAVEHSDSRTITVTFSVTAWTAVVGVTDEGQVCPVVPPPGAADAEQERGRGLLIIDALARRWGSRRAAGRMTLWAEIDLAPAEAAG
ncbi:ATP-binding protein [Streptomyces blattellae]|uniref:ATP-binding protein n=1 Tax=Streptomyces blattellae TaxID=2569855 RepID=UPI0018ACCEE1|nr:ATP-binding protein [Streptomyces blattellae]